jgi:DNA-binding LytR/AlgR family response regulator
VTGITEFDRNSQRQHTSCSSQKASLPVIVVQQQPVPRRLSGATGVDNKHTFVSAESKPDWPVAPAGETQLPDPLRSAKTDRASMAGLVQQLELLAKRQPPRIAAKAKGKIFIMEMSEIVAVQAQGNYASLKCQSGSYLLRESLGSIAGKLRPYGFVQIHRSILVNASFVDEVWPLPTGEYRLRVRDGAEYTVTRRFKNNLKHLAYIWLGSERTSNSAQME